MEKSKTIEKLFYYIVTCSYLALPLMYLFLRPKTKYSLIVALYGIIAFSLLFVFDSLPKNLKTVYVCVYTITEYSFFSTLLYFAIRNRKYRQAIIVLSIGFIVFQIIYFLTVEIGRLDSVPVGIETILVFIYVFLMLYEQFKKPETGSVVNTYSFWLALGMLLYLGGSFFFNIMINYINSKEIPKYLYITYIPEFLKNIFFAIAIFLYSNNTNNKTPSLKTKNVPYLDMV